VIFLNSASSAATLVIYLPFSDPSMKSGVHSEEKTERGQSPEYILKFSKKKQYLIKLIPFHTKYSKSKYITKKRHNEVKQRSEA